MKVQSTGLGESVMVAQFHDLLHTEFQQKGVLQMTMESTEPLHWYIRVYLEPKDVRRAILLGLRPSIIWKAALAFLFGRFSIFSKAKPDAENKASETTEKPGVLPTPPGTRHDEEVPNPLARLKG